MHDVPLHSRIPPHICLQLSSFCPHQHHIFHHTLHTQINQPPTSTTTTMLRQITRLNVAKSTSSVFRPATITVRSMADSRIEQASQAAGEAKDTNPKVLFLRRGVQTPFTNAVFCYQNPSVVSSGGAIGKQFNPDGAIGQVGEAVSQLIPPTIQVAVGSTPY